MSVKLRETWRFEELIITSLISFKQLRTGTLFTPVFENKTGVFIYLYLFIYLSFKQLTTNPPTLGDQKI